MVEVENVGFSSDSLCKLHREFEQNQGFSSNFQENPPVCVQIDLSQSSGGVGWSADYYDIVISMRTPRLTGLEVHRKSLTMISRLRLF